MFAGVIVLAIIGVDEISRAFIRGGVDFGNWKWIGCAGALFFICFTYFFGQPAVPKIFALLLFFVLISFVFSFPRVNVICLGATLFISTFIGYFFSFAFLLRQLNNGFFFLLLAFLLSWATDVGAYASGRLWGKHKLAVQLSPNKTKEGAIGGICLSIVVSVVAFAFVSVQASLLEAVALGLLASLAGQFGDLFASAVKRQAGIKDFGNMFPGHGGVLDRFDSFLLVAPLVYYYLGLFIIN